MNDPLSQTTAFRDPYGIVAEYSSPFSRELSHACETPLPSVSRFARGPPGPFRCPASDRARSHRHVSFALVDVDVLGQLHRLGRIRPEQSIPRHLFRQSEADHHQRYRAGRMGRATSIHRARALTHAQTAIEKRHRREQLQLYRRKPREPRSVQHDVLEQSRAPPRRVTHWSTRSRSRSGADNSPVLRVAARSS